MKIQNLRLYLSYEVLHLFTKKSQSCANIVTCSHAKIVLKGPIPSTPKVDHHKDKPIASPSIKNKKITTSSISENYSILEQLQ